MISRNLSHRIMTGLPLAAAACWYIFGANEMVFSAITVMIGVIAYYEFGHSLHIKKIPVHYSILYLSQCLVFVALWFLIRGDSKVGLGLLGITPVLMLTGFLSPAGREQKAFLWYLFPVFWIMGPLALLYLLRFKLVSSQGSQLIFFIVLVAAFNDIFAYFGGKKFGRRPLAKVISPNKTIEGSLFGIAGGLIAGLSMSTIWLNNLLPVWKAIPIIIILVISSQIGDLIESRFKRFCGVKDSSNLIPGHGGLLDRIDAYLLALPTFIGLLYIFGII